MAIDEETLKPLHQLSKLGEKNYREYLLEASDEMLLKANHPVTFWIQKCIEWLGFDEDFVLNRYQRILDQIRTDRQ